MDDAGKRILGRVKASSRRMSRMIEQILDLTRSRLGGGLEMTLSAMNLCPTIIAVADELRTAHPSRVIEVRCPPSVGGTWDADRLEQVFSNLIGNAVHYGDGSSVQIGVVENGDEVIVSVHNDGAPIPEKLQADLFSPFRRGERDSRTAETAGLGLGLYISREIVLAHGGNIEVSSTATEGTTFRVTLPRTPQKPALNLDPRSTR
jgi:phosphoserine phosphatase RsbU/P